ncbi:hypothetical protein Tco_0821185 [Tanacetum coccineum]|uniref:Transposase (Putative), gypsy type n=1 Tax=Tanacetum coccineum TaxID=301880 RepID=A0ABQ5AFS5_9ASTR
MKLRQTVVEDAAPVQPKRQKKRKTIIVDAGESSHPAKRLRDDHGTLGGPTIGGRSRSAVQRLLAGAVQNAEVRGEVMPTLPFVTSSVFATPKPEGGDHTESLAGANLCTIGAPQRFIISSDSSHHSSVNVAEAEVDYVVRTSVPIMTSVTTTTPTADPAIIAKEKLVVSSVFGADIFSAVISLSAKVRMRAEYNIKEKRGLKSVVNEQTELLKVREKEIKSLKAQLLVKEAEAAEALRLHAKASKFEVVKKSLREEAQVLKERNTTLEKAKCELEVKVADLAASVKVREQEVADLDVVVTSIKSQNDSLVGQVLRGLETSSAGLQEKVTENESCIDQLEKFQDDKMKEVNDKFDKLYIDFVEMALHLEEKFYPHLLTTIAGRRWLLTYDMKLAIVKCLHSSEYLSALGAAISKAIEKGMQDGLAAGITHGKEGRVLTDVAAFNPSAESDYVSALRELQDVNFSLLAELKSNKDASVETLMNILRLEETLTERLGLNESQPHVDQLMVPIHHSPDQTVVGATSLSFSLDVSHNRVQKIRDNIANHRSAPRDVFVSLAEPLSSVALEGTEGTSGTAPDTTTALSNTYASASSIPSISTDDYVVVHADSQESAGADVNPFPNVDDAELNIS